MSIEQLIKDLSLLSFHTESSRAVTNVITRLVKKAVGSELFSLVPFFGFSGEQSSTQLKVREYLAKMTPPDFTKMEELESLLLKYNLLQRGYIYSQYHNTHVITTRPRPIMYNIADYAIDVSRYINTAECTLIKFDMISLGTVLLKLKTAHPDDEVTTDKKTLKEVADFFLMKTFSRLATYLDDREDIAILIASYLRNVVNMPSKEVLFYGIKPVDAGDVPSKAQAGTLYQLGLLTHGVYKDKQGFRILTYLGHEVGKLMQKEESSNA